MENDRSDALVAALTELRFVRDLLQPETMSGSHLKDSNRAQAAFAVIDNAKRRARQCIKDIEDMTTADKCPVCAAPFKPTDMCLSDIDMGACHAACLEDSPMVDLNTGDPLPEGAAPPEPFPYSDLFPTLADNAQAGEGDYAEHVRAAFNEAINFALDTGVDCPLDFLRAWREGETSEWPEFNSRYPFDRAIAKPLRWSSSRASPPVPVVTDEMVERARKAIRYLSHPETPWSDDQVRAALTAALSSPNTEGGASS